MLKIQKIAWLANWIDVDVHRLRSVAENRADFIEELTVWDPVKNNKRDVIQARGLLRKIQERLYRRVFLPKIIPSIYSHGCVKGRSPKSNCLAHSGQDFGFSADISQFFPSISNVRVNRQFLKRLHCAPEVAHFLTKLCTHDYHLPLGLPTSPILADCVLSEVDRRIGAACAQHELVYTRYVDDIVVSGKFDLSNSFIGSTIAKILGQHGFRSNREKEKAGSLDDDILITKLRMRRGKPDVSSAYVLELERVIQDHRNLAIGKHFVGPFFLKAQIDGKINFACSIRPGRRKYLIAKMRSVDFPKCLAEALDRGILAAQKVVLPRDAPSPDLSVHYGSDSVKRPA